MLKHTFRHLTDIGPKKEALFWENRIFSWEDLLAQPTTGLARMRVSDQLKQEVVNSIRHHDAGDPAYFGDRLPPSESWRLFADFREAAAYVDIETTGLTDPEITTIALYDGRSINTYVNGRNLDDFPDAIRYYPLIITYNGKTFDVPIIETVFRIKLNAAHIDLRYVLKSLGHSGGLKRCEQQMGISRGRLSGVDGWFAVLLWRDYYWNSNLKALETLLAYNIEDVVNLEKLMVMAFNRKIARIPHLSIPPLPDPDMPPLPFAPDLATIDRLRYANAG